MSEKNFYYQLAEKIKNGQNAHDLVMQELGSDIADNKNDFIDVLRSSGIETPDNSSLSDLVDKFIENAPKNDELLISTALFIAHHNKTTNADGESEISDTGVKALYKTMYHNFAGEEYSNVVTAIAKAVQAGANLGNTVVEGRNQKKYGAQIGLQKQQEARGQLVQSIVAKKQQEAELKAKKRESEQKTLRVVIWSGVGLLTVSAGLFIYFKFIKKK